MKSFVAFAAKLYSLFSIFLLSALELRLHVIFQSGFVDVSLLKSTTLEDDV